MNTTPTITGLADRLGWLERDRLAGTIQEQPNAAALWARSEGAATRLVGMTWVDDFQGVLTLPDRGIAAPAQLAGCRLALPQRAPTADALDVARATARRGFHAATQLAGLFSDEVEWVDVPVAGIPGATPYAAEAAALLRGEVDAIHVSGPAGRELAARIGAIVVVDLGAHLDPMVRVNATTPIALTADARLAAEQPERVVRALAALLRAGDWAHANGVHDQLHVDLSTRKLAALSWQKDFLLTHGFLARDVELAAWADPQPLDAARDLLAEARRVA